MDNNVKILEAQQVINDDNNPNKILSILAKNALKKTGKKITGTEILKQLKKLKLPDDANVITILEKLADPNKKDDVDDVDVAESLEALSTKLAIPLKTHSDKVSMILRKLAQLHLKDNHNKIKILKYLGTLKIERTDIVDKVNSKLETLKKKNDATDKVIEDNFAQWMAHLKSIKQQASQLEIQKKDNSTNVDEILEELKKLNTKDHANVDKILKERTSKLTDLKNQDDAIVDQILAELKRIVDDVVDHILTQLAQLDRNENLFILKIFEQLLDVLHIEDENEDTDKDKTNELHDEFHDDLNAQFNLLEHFELCFRLGDFQYDSFKVGWGMKKYNMVRNFLIYQAQRKDLKDLRQDLTKPLIELPKYIKHKSGSGGQGDNKTNLNKCLMNLEKLTAEKKERLWVPPEQKLDLGHKVK